MKPSMRMSGRLYLLSVFIESFRLFGNEICSFFSSKKSSELCGEANAVMQCRKGGSREVKMAWDYWSVNSSTACRTRGTCRKSTREPGMSSSLYDTLLWKVTCNYFTSPVPQFLFRANYVKDLALQPSLYNCTSMVVDFRREISVISSSPVPNPDSSIALTKHQPGEKWVEKGIRAAGWLDV